MAVTGMWNAAWGGGLNQAMVMARAALRAYMAREIFSGAARTVAIVFASLTSTAWLGPGQGLPLVGNAGYVTLPAFALYECSSDRLVRTLLISAPPGDGNVQRWIRT